MKKVLMTASVPSMIGQFNMNNLHILLELGYEVHIGCNFKDRSVLNDLPENAQVFYSRLPDGSVIAASIILMANGRMNYHLSGSRREYNDFSPVNMLLYKAALWGYANGYKTFYLGGGVGSAADSLLTFKKAFYRGKLNHFYIGKKFSILKYIKNLLSIEKKTAHRLSNQCSSQYIELPKMQKYNKTNITM